MTIQNARSNTSGNAPPSLQDGQIAINQVDDVLFSRRADGTIRRLLMPKRYGVSDAAFTIRPFDTYIGIASLTAPRPLTLPAASSYPAGQPLVIADEVGACSTTNIVTVTAGVSDKIDGAATLPLTAAYGALILVSDGTSKWTVIVQPAAGAPNSVLYVMQSILPGQQLQARRNIGTRGAGVAAVAASDNYTVTSSDIGRLLACGGTFTLPLTAAATLGNGFAVELRATSGTITVDPNGAETVNGAPTLTLASGQAATLLCDGVGWHALLHTYTPPSSAPTVTAYSAAGASGYRRWSDGFIEQWGQTSVTGDTFIVYPISFPNAGRMAVASPLGNTSDALSCMVDSIGQSSFAARVRDVAPGGNVTSPAATVSWFAIGY